MPLQSTRGAASAKGFGLTSGAPKKFIVATGGTVTTSGDYKIHTFSSPGTFEVTCAGNIRGSDTVEYLVVAGGGAGGQYIQNVGWGSPGGAGGYRASSGSTAGSYPIAPLSTGVSGLKTGAGTFPITIGGGGPAGGGGGAPGNGSPSIFSTITSTGGGGGAGTPGIAGAPGGGGGYGGGSGNTPPVSPPQGFPDSTGAGNGNQPNQSYKGNGYIRDGVNTLIQGAFPVTTVGEPYNSTRWFSGTGGQAATPGENEGGLGGGGPNASPGTPGTANTGGSGGAGGTPGAPGVQAGGSGGSGVIILRYKFQ